jgi:integrase/recombinase XerD
MIDPKKDPQRRCMPLAEWPEMDRAAWTVAVRQGNLLDGQGPAAHWRPKTQKSVIAAYGRFLTFLERQGWLERSVGPETRLTPDRLRAYIAELVETVFSVTVSGRITNLAEALRVMTPGTEFLYLNRARRRLKVRAQPVRNKRSRIVPIRDLLRLGLDLIERAETGTFARELWRACVYRDGVMILILCSRPIRRDNLAGMRLGKELTKFDGAYALALPETETKNHRPYDRSLDAELTPFIDRYLEHFRPILLGASLSDRVWISCRGLAMSGDSIYGKICDHTQRAFGHSISPHLFRDCAMTSLADEDPEHVWLGMSLLHHADPRIAEQHYDHALVSDAVRQYQSYITKSRRKMVMQRAQGMRHRKKRRIA